MLIAKRLICGIFAFILIILGAMMTSHSMQVFQVLGFCVFIFGITLAYIAIKQNLPTYSFWITLLAMGLAYALLVNKNSSTDSETETVAYEEVSPQEEKTGDVSYTAKKHKKKKRGGVNLAAYPKISGSATVIHAHVFYIGGRYVRLYGVDAPDNDQLCSDANGSSYNCGEAAASWVRNWIDTNPIDCYILKVEPKGQDLATCVWGEYDIGAGLVSSGWGLANTRETNIYKPYEIMAQNESAGLWQGTFYTPADWRDIKSRRNDFTIKRQSSSGGGLFDFGSWFK